MDERGPKLKQALTPRFEDDANYYEVLGVPTDTSPEELARAHRTLAATYHPNAASGGDERIMRRVTEAYAALKTTEKRRAYDREQLEKSSRHERLKESVLAEARHGAPYFDNYMGILELEGRIRNYEDIISQEELERVIVERSYELAERSPDAYDLFIKGWESNINFDRKKADSNPHLSTFLKNKYKDLYQAGAAYKYFRKEWLRIGIDVKKLN